MNSCTIYKMFGIGKERKDGKERKEGKEGKEAVTKYVTPVV